MDWIELSGQESTTCLNRLKVHHSSCEAFARCRGRMTEVVDLRREEKPGVCAYVHRFLQIHFPCGQVF